MSLWQSPYRPPPIRSKAVVRVHRSFGDGAGEALPPIAPPAIIPLQRGYWAAYGKQTLACGLGLLMSLFFLWGSWVYTTEGDEERNSVVLVVHVHPDPNGYWDSNGGWYDAMEERGWVLSIRTRTPIQPEEQASSTVYTWLAGAIALMTLIIPLFFYARWRKLEQIFGEDMYESDEGLADDEADEELSSEELLRRHPNRGKILDGTQVGLMALLLICTAGVQAVAGSMLLFVDTPTGQLVGPTLWKVFGAGLLVQAAVNLVLMVATLRHVVGASRLALYLCLGGVCLSLITVHWLAIAACGTGAILMWRMHMAFKMMLARVAEPDKRDPLEAYYHNLLQLLVWVMRADGHCDRRELHKIKSTCDAMNLSSWERDVVIASANLDNRKELRSAAKRYLEAATATQIADPGNGMLVVAAAVAGADGVIAKQETDALRELAKLVGVAPEHVNQLLLHQQLHLEALNTTKAHELLRLDDGATRAQVEAAHATLATELEETRYQHIGTSLAELLHQRHAMLDRARDLLLQQATA